MADADSEKTGISTAVDQTLAASDAKIPGWSGQQLSLLPSTALTGDDVVDGEERQEAAKRGKGRPPGSENKKTMEWMKYINARYTNPLVFLAECYNRPAKDLATELSCTTEKAFAFQMAAATKMTEYTNQKMPTTVDLGVDGDLSLVIQTVWQGASANPGDGAIEAGGVIIDLPSSETDGNPGDEAQDVVLDQE